MELKYSWGETLQIPKLEGKFWTIQKLFNSITYEFKVVLMKNSSSCITWGQVVEDFKAFTKWDSSFFITYGNLMSFNNHKCDFSYNLRTSYKNTFYEQLLD